jgi:hypothetical protein
MITKKKREKAKKDVTIIITPSGQTTFDNVWPPMKAIGIMISVSIQALKRIYKMGSQRI